MHLRIAQARISTDEHYREDFIMKNETVIWLGLGSVMLILLAACGGATQTPQAEEPIFVESVIPEEPATAEIEIVPKISVTFNSTVHSSDLGGYAWIQEYMSSNDVDAADARSWSESARAGAVCFASIAPSVKSAPSDVDGSFSITFEAEPGSTFRIMCDPDETHSSALGIDVFTVPVAGGNIDHAEAGFLYPGLWTPELGIANELAAIDAGYADVEEMFKSAGTCRVLALPGEGATIVVLDGDAYGFYMEAPDTAGRVTMLTEPAGAYIVIKDFGGGDSVAEIDIDFKVNSGAGLTWSTATCPIKKGFSTHLEVQPTVEIAADRGIGVAGINFTNFIL